MPGRAMPNLPQWQMGMSSTGMPPDHHGMMPNMMPQSMQASSGRDKQYGDNNDRRAKKQRRDNIALPPEANRELYIAQNKAIIAARGDHDLAGYVLQNCEKFNHVNVATALHKLAKSLAKKSDKPNPPKVLRPWYPCFTCFLVANA